MKKYISKQELLPTFQMLNKLGLEYCTHELFTNPERLERLYRAFLLGERKLQELKKGVIDD
jgi:hypothetical protein